MSDVKRGFLAETGALAIEGAAPILNAHLGVTVEYLVGDPLTD